jgi:hypothetical protein
MIRLKNWIKIEEEYKYNLLYNENIFYFLLNKKDIFDNDINDIYYKKIIKNNKIKWKLTINLNSLLNNSDIYTINLLEQEIKQNNNIIDEIDWRMLSYNVNAINILSKYIDKIDWSVLSCNYNALLILKYNFDKIDWINLGHNKNAIFIISDDLENLTWDIIYSKLKYLKKKYSKNTFNNFSKTYNFDKKIFISSFSKSDNKYVLKLLEENPKEIDWKQLSQNPYGINIIEKNFDKIYFPELCGNPKAIHLIMKHFEKFDIDFIKKNNYSYNYNYQYRLHWVRLCKNPEAINFLEKHPDKLSLIPLYQNPAIFEYDYEKMANKISIFKEELIQKAMHPNRIKNLLDNNISNNDLEYILDNL